ncbi:MAG: hypothetical protein IJS40_05195 [Synergistaceae bacterium]|nr:hypothetical protein [Synergistaceae bacterium]
MLLAALCVLSVGCGGGHSGLGSSGNVAKDLLENKTFGSTSGTKGTGTATYNGGAVSVDISDVSISFANVTTAATASVQTVAITASVTASYKITINGTTQSYGPETKTVELTETSSAVYAFSFGDILFTIDPTSKIITFAGKFTFDGTEYTVSTPIEIGVTESVSLNGAWIYESGTISGVISGDSRMVDVAFTPLQFVTNINSSNLASDKGSANFSMVLCLSGDSPRAIRIPVLYENVTLTTSRDADDRWTLSNGSFSFDFDPSKATLTVNGTSTGAKTANIKFDNVVLRRPDMSKITAIDVSTVLKDSTWTLNEYTDAYKNGGYIVFGNAGEAFSDRAFSSIYFDNVNVADGTGHMTALVTAPATVYDRGTSAAAVLSGDMTFPLIISQDITLTKIVDNIYKFDLGSTLQPTKGVIVFSDDKTATIVVDSTYGTYGGENYLKAGFMFTNLTKKTQTDTEFATALGSANIANTTWVSSEDMTGGMIYDSKVATKTMVLPAKVSDDNPFTIKFIDIDIANKAATISADGVLEYTTSADSALTTVSVDIGAMLTALDSNTTTRSHDLSNITHAGYNTLFATIEDSRFAVILQDTADSAFVFVDLVSGDSTSRQSDTIVSISGAMKKQQ